MPHLTLEYSSNLIERHNLTTLFKKCHETLALNLPTDINGCKSRAIECSDFYIGHGEKNNAFLHVKIEVMPGRSVLELQKTQEEIAKLLKHHFAVSLQNLNLQITIALDELPLRYTKIIS